MKKFIAIVLFSFMTYGCASFIEVPNWPDSAYGVSLEKVALEGWLSHHEQFRSAPNTSSGSDKTYHYTPAAIASGVDHSIWSAAEMESRGDEYELVVLTGKFATPHSVVQVGNYYLDINFQEPRLASEYTRSYDNARSLGKVKAKNVHGVLTALGYTYK